MHKIPKWLKITGGVLVGLLVLIVIVNATSGDKGQGNNATQEPTQAQTANRCVDVPADILASLQETINTQGITLGKAKAVKSNDFKSVYFISVDLQGAGLEGNEDIATFITNRLENGGGIFMSVNNIAKEFSVLPDASKTDAKATMSDDGAQASQDCLRH
jgi:hypothetical protein